MVIGDQRQFDKVFGVAMVMGDKSHRLPKEIFSGHLVLAAIKRGKAVWEFKVTDVTADGGVVELRYTARSKPSASATFASPLIVSVPTGYRAVRFWENGKVVKEALTPISISRTAPSIRSKQDGRICQEVASKTGWHER